MQSFFEGLIGSIKQETGVITIAFVAALYLWGPEIYAKAPAAIYCATAVVFAYVVMEKVRSIFRPKKNGEAS